MLRTAPKPKLSLSINTATQSTISAPKPKLSLSTTMSSSSSSSLVTPSSPSYTYSHSQHVRSPLTPLPSSPTAINTTFNRRALSSSSTSSSSSSYLQVPTYNYVNSCQAKSVLKRDSASSSSSVPRKTCQINIMPTAVHAITPIDDADYWYKPVGRW